MLDFLNKQIELQKDFTYKNLFNIDRGAIFKDEDISLLKQGINEGLIKVEKYMIADKIDRHYLLDILEKNRKNIYKIISKMKDYHNESDYLLTPFLYILSLLNPDYINNYNDEECNNISIGYRFYKSNAFSRIYLNDYKIAFNSTNDNIENILDTLCINNYILYAVGIENELSKYQNIVAYKLVAQPEISKIRDSLKDEFRLHIFDLKKKDI